MINKKRFKTLLKIGILLIVIVLIIFLVPTTYSRFESKGSSNTGLDVAFYLVKPNYYTENILLREIVPREEPYTYTFDIKNNDGSKRTETNLEYDLSIKTTTNLPLEYELYMDEEYTSSGATNILNTPGPVADDDGTYFITMTTPKRYFYHSSNETHTYQLVVYFSEDYKNHEYQDITESVQIIVDAKQIISE